MTALAAPNYLPKVREQYEALPYPPYNPEQDRVQLRTTIGDQLDYLNHRFWDGRQTFGPEFRALAAGDGTGNSSVFLAEQLREHGGQVVSLDLSSASQAIAKRRADIRQLTNITHINASLLDIETLGIGQFDYIACSGVLHHLADPDAGLRALASALKPGGVIRIMVYASVGRTAVYQMQDMLRLLLNPDDSMESQIALTRTVLANLPRRNWFWFNNAPFMNDITQWGDSGIFDLLLHTQDRAYTVPEIYDWTERCGLTLAEFCTATIHPEILYNPASYCKAPELQEVFASLPLREQQAVAERLAGNMHMHLFYACKTEPAAELSCMDETLIPSLSVTSPLHGLYLRDVCQHLRANTGKPSLTINVPELKLSTTFTPLQATADLLEAINNERTIGELVEHVATLHPLLSKQEISQQWQSLYTDLRRMKMVALRRHQGARITPVHELHQRSLALMER